MVVDTSVLIAILMDEPEAQRLVDAMIAAPSLALSAASFVEASIVAESKAGPGATAELDQLLDELQIAVIAVTPEQGKLARDAYRSFGKGRHPAALNFGDCFSYALARGLGESLLFVGHDFSDTDIEAASY